MSTRTSLPVPTFSSPLAEALSRFLAQAPRGVATMTKRVPCACSISS